MRRISERVLAYIATLVRLQHQYTLNKQLILDALTLFALSVFSTSHSLQLCLNGVLPPPPAPAPPDPTLPAPQRPSSLCDWAVTVQLAPTQPPPADRLTLLGSLLPKPQPSSPHDICRVDRCALFSAASFFFSPSSSPRLSFAQTCTNNVGLTAMAARLSFFIPPRPWPTPLQTNKRK